MCMFSAVTKIQLQKFLSVVLHTYGILLLFHNRWQQSGGAHCHALNSNRIYLRNLPEIQKAQGLRREQNVHRNPPDNWKVKIRHIP